VRRRNFKLALCLTLALAGALPGEPAPRLRFSDATAAAGIDFTATSGKEPSSEILEVNGGGVALFDYDNDGDLDIFFANGATMEDTEQGPGSRLYANDGRGRFEDVTEQVGIRLKRWAMGVAVGDYDADGDDDLYVTCYGANVLLRNDAVGEGRRFVDVTEQAGVGDTRWGSSAAFGDVDGDGDLDLYVVNYVRFDVAKPPPRKMFKGAPIFGGPAGMRAEEDALYSNDGDGTFTNVTHAWGCMPSRPAYGLGVVIQDFDDDGRQEVYVGNDSMENFLFRRGEDGRCKELGVLSGLASNYDGRTQATMGIALGDVDGNGRVDLFTTNFSSDTNTLHLNLGRSLYDDRTSQFGLAAVSRPFLGWGAGFYDFDLDGDEDLFVVNGHIYAEAETHEIDSEYRQPVLLFERDGRQFRRNETAGAPVREPYSGRAAAFGDLDDDGDVDVVMVTLNDRARLFRNEAPRRDVVVVELRGGSGNRTGLGSRVELSSGETTQRRWIHGGSFQSVNAPLAYFGAPGKKPRLTVRWEDGTTVDYGTVRPNRRILVHRGKEEVESFPLGGREAGR
jgi:hypothetical protein